MQFKQKRIAALVSLALALGTGSAEAVLQRMGPINNAPTVGGFPSWFQDTTGVTMEFCDLMTAAELNGGWCTLIPPGPVFPEVFPSNFFIEHFYWDSTNVARGLGPTGGTTVRFTMAVEGSFTNGAIVVPGQQMTFGRVRLFMTNLPFSGTYTVYHPYGKWVFPNQVAGDRLFFTDDVGIGCPGTFDCTLGTTVGPFLLPSATPGGAEVPPVVSGQVPMLAPGLDPFYDALAVKKADPGTGKKYLTDPGRIGPVTGSPLAPFTGSDGLLHNHNTLRIEGPNGFVYDGPNNFTLNGRLLAGAIPGATTVDRASYAIPNKLDVFATATPATAARLPASPVPPTVTPALSFYEGPCGGALSVDPVTGLTVVNPPPYTAPLLPKLSMSVQGSSVWGQSQPLAIPAYTCVEDDTARDALGNIVPAFYLKKVTDDVAISLASYNGPLGGLLTVNATSSDPASVLTLAGFGVAGTGLDLVAGSASVSALLAPPAKVQVVSSNGGVAILPVTTALGAATIAGVPTAVNDTVTMFEDCSALPAITCATPQILTPLANDTVNGGPIPAGATVTITQAPRLGTAVVNLDGTITYTPNANVNGADAIGYTVSSAGQVSNTALISITITAVNDFPVAVNDATGALRGFANQVNVFANDTSPDGSAVFTGGSAVIVTGNPALGITAGTSFLNGIVSYTPPSTTAAGTYTFTYNAVDVHGMVSQTPATVTVTVSTAEAIVPTKTIYTQAKGLWTLQGTVAPAAGQTITGTYVDGTYKVAGACTGNAAGTTIGSATADALGNWLYAQALTSTAGVQNPSNSGGNSTGFWCTPPKTMRFTSSLTGASVTFPISLK